MGMFTADQDEPSMIITVGETIFNLMVLNVLWIICSIPVVTAGASTTALNYTCIKLRKDEGDSVLRMFFHSFTANIRQALILHTGMLAVLIIFSACLFQVVGRMLSGSTLDGILAVILVVLLFVWILLYTYIFMVLARFDNTTGRTLTNAVYMILHDKLPALRVFGTELFLMITLPYVLWTYVPYLFPLVIFFGIPFNSWVLAKQFNEIFDQYITGNKAEAPARKKKK